MTKDEVAHLARLARIGLTPAEVDNFGEQITSILSYVSAVNSIAADSTDDAPVLGVVHNVFRTDEVTVPARTHDADLIASMPETEGRFLKVKKILSQDD